MSDRIDRFEVGFVFVTIAAGSISGVYAQPFIHGNEEAVGLLATVFSILAGLLIGIVTMLSDTSVLSDRGWRAAVLAKPILTRRLHRHRLLFLVYLSTLVLLLVSTLIPERFPSAIQWLERAYVFFGTIGFIYSFRLPWTLARIQEERLDSLIRDRRHAAGLDRGSTTS